MNFVLCTFAGLGLGWLLDHFFHWGTWIILVGFFFGIVTSYFILIQDIKALNRVPPKPPAS